MFKSKFGTVLLMILGVYALFVLFGFFTKAGLNKVDDSIVEGQSVNDIIKDYVRKEITPDWLDYNGTVKEIKVTDVISTNIKHDEGSKTILSSEAIIKGYYFPTSVNNQSKQIKFKIKKNFHIDVSTREVRLLN